MHAIFGPLLGHIRMGLVLRTLCYQEIKSPNSLHWVDCLVWECLSLFQTQCVLFCSS